MLPPLPERMRPKNLSEYVGQRHLVGEGCILRKMIENGNLSSFILGGRRESENHFGRDNRTDFVKGLLHPLGGQCRSEGCP